MHGEIAGAFQRMRMTCLREAVTLWGLPTWRNSRDGGAIALATRIRPPWRPMDLSDCDGVHEREFGYA